MTNPPSPPLRVALLVDSLELPGWVHRILSTIAGAGYAEIVAVVRRRTPTEPGTTRLRTLYRNRAKLLFAAYDAYSRRRRPEEPSLFGRSSIEPLIPGCPVLDVEPITTRHTDRLRDDDIEKLRALDIDVMLRFGFRILKGEVLTLPRYGVWSYHHGDDRTRRGGPPGFWEVMEGAPTTGSVLQILTEQLDAGRVIWRSYAPTDQASVQANRANYYAKSAAFVPRMLQRLHAEGPSALETPESSTWSPYGERLYSIPDNREMARLLWKRITRRIRRRAAHLLWIEQWFIAFKSGPPRPDARHAPDTTFYNVRPLIPPKDRFWADPFPVRHEGRSFIFLEEMLSSRGKAHISVIEIDRDGRAGPPRKVLERDYHLSYPFVFEWQGNHYMIPETGANRTVELYRAVAFPFEWELDRVLLSGVYAVDATVAQIAGEWWMFVNVAEDGASSWDELRIYHGESPLGPWQPHRANPVKSDVRNARPAGRVFMWGGAHYRPAQDCSVSYGYAITINRIDELTRDRYRETEVGKILPAWMPGLLGTHTINADGGLTAIDGRIRRRRFF